MHDGQICIPFPGGKLRLAHMAAPYNAGMKIHAKTPMARINHSVPTRSFSPNRTAPRTLVNWYNQPAFEEIVVDEDAPMASR